MPKSALYLLSWSGVDQRYTLQSQDHTPDRPWHDDWWFDWLAEHQSFAFQGQQGHLSLLKEARKRGSDYWYAYRSRQRRTAKKYAGRSSDLTPTHLEALALALNPAEKVPQTSLLQQARPSISEEPQLFPLLRFKLEPPRLSSSLIRRERLWRQLDSALEQSVTLLSAPAGSGKTTLVSQWLAEREPSRSVWLRLDGGDNDLIRFWRYLIAACQSLPTQPGQIAATYLAASLQPPFNPPDMNVILTLLLNDLLAMPNPSVLVIDDYHLIDETHIHETLAFWLERLPEALHVLLLSRSVPASLPLSRLNARNALYQLPAADLRFTIAETDLFLQKTLALPLMPQSLTLLHSHLEGWAAGLRLLTLALRGQNSQQELESKVAAFVGSHRLVLDYFVSEVLNALPASHQDFLLRTSVLKLLSAPLCAVITGQEDGAERLASMERVGMFLEALDTTGVWFRYHPLFAEAMQSEAQRRLGSNALRAIVEQASQWFEEQGRFREAIEAALQAQMMQRAAVLIGRLIESQPLHQLEDADTLLYWLQQIPNTFLKYAPILCQYYASALLFSGKVSPANYDQLETLLLMAEEGWSELGHEIRLGETRTFRAMLASRQGASQQALALARDALGRLPLEAHAWRTISAGIVGIGAFQEGQFREAYAALQETRAYWEAIGNFDALRGINLILANILFEQAALHKARECYRQMLALARQAKDAHDSAYALQGLAAIAYEHNALTSAEEQAQEALNIQRQLTNKEREIESELFLAQVEHARGESGKALQRLTALSAMLHTNLSSQQATIFAQLHAKVQAEQASLSLATGDDAGAQRWINRSYQQEEPLSKSQRDHDEQILVRLLIIQGRFAEAQLLLGPLLESARARAHTRAVLKLDLLQALVYAATGQPHAARKLLLLVLKQAHSESFMRLFLNEGRPMAGLLQQVLPEISERPLRSYAQNLLQAFAREPVSTQSPAQAFSGQLGEPLSSHELRVLRLLVAGRSNREIAAEQVVSVNTIRTQVQSIYRKLGVNNRVEASALARELHIL